MSHVLCADRLRGAPLALPRLEQLAAARVERPCISEHDSSGRASVSKKRGESWALIRFPVSPHAVAAQHRRAAAAAARRACGVFRDVNSPIVYLHLPHHGCTGARGRSAPGFDAIRGSAAGLRAPGGKKNSAANWCARSRLSASLVHHEPGLRLLQAEIRLARFAQVLRLRCRCSAARR